MARHADVVLPATMTLERNDIGGSPNDPCLIAMRQAVAPYARGPERVSRSSPTSPGRSASGPRFTEGGTRWRGSGTSTTAGAPRSPADGGRRFAGFDEFWAAGFARGAGRRRRPGDPSSSSATTRRARALGTPSGRIEIFSATIDGFGYADCPGHPSWLEPTEWLGAPLAGRFPLHLVANNPTARLHSQLDVGAFSQASKVQGREPIRIHPVDAAHARRPETATWCACTTTAGAVSPGAVVTRCRAPRVVQLATGAWYDPLDPADPDAMCVHGNPNVLTFDRGTSKLAQACSGQHALVEVERWTGPCRRSARTIRRRPSGGRSADPSMRDRMLLSR